MGQVNNFGQNSPELQKIDQLESPLSDLGQKVMLKKPESDSTEWSMTPAELYGCLCHKPEGDKGKERLERK